MIDSLWIIAIAIALCRKAAAVDGEMLENEAVGECLSTLIGCSLIKEEENQKSKDQIVGAQPLW